MHDLAGAAMNRNRVALATQRGFSIIELMIALVLGLVVLAAVFVSTSGMAVASRQQRAAAVMTDDAMLALSLIRHDLLLAAYVHPESIQGGRFGPLDTVMLDRPVFGCNQLFQDPNAPLAQAQCPGGNGVGDWGHAIEINFEATRDSVVLDSDDKFMTDCRGVTLKDANGQVPSDVAGPGTRLSTSHRYFVKRTNKDQPPSLFCASATSTSQALVPNVEFLQIRYGVSSHWTSDQAAARRPVRYVDASAFTPSVAGSSTPHWSDVVAVHLCILMRSEEAVLDASETQTLDYIDCSGDKQTSKDRRLYRAYATTVALRNRIAY